MNARGFELISRCAIAFFAAYLIAGAPATLRCQDEQQTERGHLWEDIRNDGWYGSLGAWDYLVNLPLGFYPGFANWHHPVGNENMAINTYANANFHNFRSGCWVLVKDMMTPGVPPTYTPTNTPVEAYLSGLQEDTYGIEPVRQPLALVKNYIESPTYDPGLPEEMTIGTWNTNTAVTVTRHSYTWGFPGYRDFIIYDYSFKNTGLIVSDFTSQVVPNFMQQTLNGVLFVFLEAVSVSTKSQINFHAELTPVQAGAFGWLQPAYHDFFYAFDNGQLVFSRNYNGGASPPPFDPYAIKPNEAWQQKFGPELESPSAFGMLALYADPTGAAPRTSPTPDFLRIDSHKGGTFQGQPIDFESFRKSSGVSNQKFYNFAMTPDSQNALGNTGNRMNFYTFTYGPYTLHPGDSVRIIVAEIAGVMDYGEVIAGDPNHHYPDSTIAAIRRNADNARNAVKWGLGATVNGIPIAAAVPPPPPAPLTVAANASVGTARAMMAVTWDKSAETARIVDGSGAVFYDGANDLDGYRVYRSTDFQYTSETDPTVLRGAAWTLLTTIPKSDFGTFYDPGLGRYRYLDSTISFGYKYGYYVAGYRNSPRAWTSPNGTVVNNLPPMESGDYNRTGAASASPGPVTSFDIFVVPNPYVFNDPNRSFGINDPYKIEFRNLPEACTIRIYTLSGDLVQTIEHHPDANGGVYGSENWDQKSHSGLLVAPGLYIYHVESKTPGLSNKLTGKLMIIR